MKKTLLILVAAVFIAMVGFFVCQYFLKTTDDKQNGNSRQGNQVDNVISKCGVYTYQDKFWFGVGKHCLDNIKLSGIYFLAKDQTNELIPSWSENMGDIFSKMKIFYEAQFNHKINIIIDKPQIIYGEKNSDDYKSGYIVNQEIMDKLKIQTTPNYFSALTIFYNSKFGSYGGGGSWDASNPDSPESNGSITDNPAFWLEKGGMCTVTTSAGTSCYSYISTAHEFGHAMSMTHPWDMDINKDSNGNIKDSNFGNVKGDVMSYYGSTLLSDDLNDPFGGYYIMDEAKEKMIVK